MSKPLIVITGKDGQLGYELLQLSVHYQDVFDFLFTDRETFNLNFPENIPSFFEKYQPSYFINCAAYTAVDKAETEKELAYLCNATAVGMIAQQCQLYACTLITISTDYVFNGLGTQPYLPGDTTDPVNYYGYTKCVGEQLALENNQKTIVIRTSWVYGTHGNNFVKTMIRLMKEKSELNVVSDQIGSPTYARDLAKSIMEMLESMKSGNIHYGIYQFSNEGGISWFEFATAIRDLGRFPCKVLPIPTTAYPTPAKRPAYSVMDKNKLINDFGITMIPWRKSLEDCIQSLL
jgi:dTDP-4-dehydrorhamnose reductase